jgi:hypothetical protein
MHRQELRVTVGEVQQRDFADGTAEIVQPLRRFSGEALARLQRQTRRGGDGERFEKFPAIHRHDEAAGARVPSCG